jgi:hypothetical protein
MDMGRLQSIGQSLEAGRSVHSAALIYTCAAHSTSQQMQPGKGRQAASDDCDYTTTTHTMVLC